MKLRRRLERSTLLAGLLGRLLAGWARFCNATTTWEKIGEAEVLAAMDDGPIVALIWHECVILGPAHVPRGNRRMAMLSDTTPIGRVAAAVQGRFGIIPFLVPTRGGDLAATREVLKLFKAGTSISLPGDGPLGPARVLKDGPLAWARAGGTPVFTYAYAMSRQKRLKSWDRMILPLPFGRGTILYRRISGPLPRKMPAADHDALRARFETAMTAVMTEAETRAGVPVKEQGPGHPR